MAKKKHSNQTHQLTPFEFVKTKARTFPIHKCYINSDWYEMGLVNIIIVRRKPGGSFLAGIYSLETYLKGIIRTRAFANISEKEIDEYLEIIAPRKRDENMIVEIDYTLAHNIIYGAIAFAKTQSFEPEFEFDCTQYILEEDDGKIEKIELDFENNIMRREYLLENERLKKLDIPSEE